MIFIVLVYLITSQSASQPANFALDGYIALPTASFWTFRKKKNRWTILSVGLKNFHRISASRAYFSQDRDLGSSCVADFCSLPVEKKNTRSRHLYGYTLRGTDASGYGLRGDRLLGKISTNSRYFWDEKAFFVSGALKASIYTQIWLIGHLW